MRIDVGVSDELVLQDPERLRTRWAPSEVLGVGVDDGLPVDDDRAAGQASANVQPDGCA